MNIPFLQLCSTGRQEMTALVIFRLAFRLHLLANRKTMRHKTHKIGKSLINASDLKGLRIAWRGKGLVPFIGAGVSIEYGVPGWRNLLLELLFKQTKQARRMRGFWPHYQRALSSWLTDYFDYDPVILARVIRNDIMKRTTRKGRTDGRVYFLDQVRNSLYATVKPQNRPTTLTAIADFIVRGIKEKRIPAVVTFNFDDFLEKELAQRRIDYQPVWSSRQLRDGRFPVIHPHGFLPRAGSLDDHEIIFTEREYHSLTDTAFHWAITEIVGFLRHYHALFIGLSMSDPNLRRLLDATYEQRQIPPHWQLQKRHEVRDQEQLQALTEIQARAKKFGALLGDRELKDPRSLSYALDASLLQADTYDRELFEGMGVKTIWLKDFDDIPKLLKAISTKRAL